MDLKEIECEGVDWILAQDVAQCQAFVYMVVNIMVS
jgi:hypothetical protein